MPQPFMVEKACAAEYATATQIVEVKASFKKMDTGRSSNQSGPEALVMGDRRVQGRFLFKTWGLVHGFFENPLNLFFSFCIRSVAQIASDFWPHLPLPWSPFEYYEILLI